MPEQVCLTINGRQISGDAGSTILELALRSSIHIPHLCAQKGLAPFGACGLCLVEASGNPRLLRACSTAAVSGMVVDSETPRVRRARAAALELMLSDHEGDCTAPCALSCPAHVDCQRFLKAISGGDMEQAAAVLLDRLPLPASIGRVCAHPCESACRRRFVEEPLSIAALQVFAAEANLNAPNPVQPRCLPATGKSVAVVGGGPCGLSAACFLARMGHRVTLFDAMPQMGGTLRGACSPNLLPPDVLDREVAQIQALGVHMVNGRRISGREELAALRAEYDAVLLAVGAQAPASEGSAGQAFLQDPASRRAELDDFPELAQTVAGRIAAEPGTFRTNMEGVFAAGDAANRGVRHAVSAVGQAADAAAAIDAFLRGTPVSRPITVRSRRKVSEDTFQAVERQPRAVFPAPGPSQEECRAEAARCMECGCAAYPGCGLLQEFNAQQVCPGRLESSSQREGVQARPGAILYDRGKCILCGQCVRVCREQAQQELLGFVGRGFGVSIRAVPTHAQQDAVCRGCRRCVELCPTGALQFTGDTD